MPPLLFHTIEQTWLSTWVRDSPSVFGYWFVLSFHAVGLAMVVGTSSVIGLRVLGVARELPLSTLKHLYPIVWTGFWIQVISGVLLTITYPTKSLMTPAFYVKLAFIAAGMILIVRLKEYLQQASEDGAMLATQKRLAFWSLFSWMGAITAGRFIGYTAKYILHPGLT